MTDPLEPPSPLASRLFDAERARPHAGGDEAARILARVGATVGVATLAVTAAATAAHASKAAKLGLTAKAAPWIVLAFAAGGGTGATLHAIATHPSPPLVAPVDVSVPVPVLPASSSSSIVLAPASPIPSARASDTGTGTGTLTSTGTGSADATLAAERALIDRARTALTRGQPATALDALDEHAKSFPRGRLVEEREALAIQALAALHRPADAMRRATAFRRAHPQSVFLPAIDLAVGPAQEIDAGP